MIGSASLYVSWHCYHFGLTMYTMHVWLSTIGVSSRNQFSTIYFSQISRLQFSVSVADDWSDTGSILIELLVILSRCANETNHTLDHAGDRLDFRNRRHGLCLLGKSNTFQDNSFDYRWVPCTHKILKHSQESVNRHDERIFLILFEFLSGLTSLILLVIGLINGTAALWSYEFSKLAKIRPVFTKLFHNLIGTAAFVIGKP